MYVECNSVIWDSPSHSHFRQKTCVGRRDSWSWSLSWRLCVGMCSWLLLSSLMLDTSHSLTVTSSFTAHWFLSSEKSKYDSIYLFFVSHIIWLKNKTWNSLFANIMAYLPTPWAALQWSVELNSITVCLPLLTPREPDPYPADRRSGPCTYSDWPGHRGRLAEPGSASWSTVRWKCSHPDVQPALASDGGSSAAGQQVDPKPVWAQTEGAAVWPERVKSF